jgi:flagellar biosynthesis GTPase FlhF
MKIVRQVSPDMRSAMRSIRAQLGEDAVILSSRKIPEGVEVTAAIDFDAQELRDAASAPALPAPMPEVAPRAATPAPAPAAASPAAQKRSFFRRGADVAPAAPAAAHAQAFAPAQSQPADFAPSAPSPAAVAAAQQAAFMNRGTHASPAPAAAQAAPFSHAANFAAPAPSPAAPQTAPISHAATSHYFPAQPAPAASFANSPAAYDHFPAPAAAAHFPQSQPAGARPFAHILVNDGIPSDIPALQPAAAGVSASISPAARAQAAAPLQAAVSVQTAAIATAPVVPTLTPDLRQPISSLGSEQTPDLAEDTLAQLPPPVAASAAASESTAAELKTLRRMLETQMAQLAWNDLSRRAPVHVEILRELTEIGITQELSEYILKQLPDKVELGFARRFAIAGLSQYLLVSGDKWLDNGGRVAFIGSTGVGKTTTLAKLAVRWVLRHGTRDLALVGSDTVRIGAQDQIQSLGQLLGVPVYTPENFESLPTLLAQIGDRHRLILIDTPGSSLRDSQSANRLSVLSNCASYMETALVLAGSTQAGAIEETVKRYAPVNPSCCVITKLDEAASLGGALSALIRARLPVAYVSEGQRVPEDLRPARALELVSTAVRLAKASGAAADEELLRRRFGKTAHAIT